MTITRTAPGCSVSDRRRAFKHTCDCPERKKPNPMARDWFVYARYCNYSAFNGYHYTPSAYSGVSCRTCGSVWRTKANYVALLPNGEFT